jgi:S-DNA-T family DNA segregation ATPase FtsK/SpoIIIE
LSDRTLDKNLSDLFYALAGIILVSLLLYGARLGEIAFFSLFALPGAFLDRIFMGLAYFFPVYLAGVGFFLRMPKANWIFFWLLQALVVPVLTLSVIFHVTALSVNAWAPMLVFSFGESGALFLLYSLLVLEIVGIVLAFMVLPQADWKLWFAQVKGKFAEKTAEVKALPDLRIQDQPQEFVPSDEDTEDPQVEFRPAEPDTQEGILGEDIRRDPFFQEKGAEYAGVEDPYDRAVYQTMEKTTDHNLQNSFTQKLEPQEPWDSERSADFISPRDLDYQVDRPSSLKEEVVDWDRLKGRGGRPSVTIGQQELRSERPEDHYPEDYESDYPGEEYYDIPIDPELTAEEEGDEGMEAYLDRDLKYAAAVEEFLPADKLQGSYTDDEPLDPDETEGMDGRDTDLQEGLESDPGENELTEIFSLEATPEKKPKKKVLESTLPKEVPYVPRGQRNSYRGYKIPTEGILRDYGPSENLEIDELTRSKADILKLTLSEFKIEAEVTGIRRGPVITMFEILPAPGVRLSKIAGLADNIALRLAAKSVRIVAPIPGKHAVGIEVPNSDRKIVGFQELIDSREFQKNNMAIPIALGKDISGEIQLIDLAKTPHLLIAGATGAGKSVSVNSLICSILYQCSPNDVKMILVDPKIVELKFFNGIPHLLTEVITEPKKALQAVQWCLYEMERRYALLDALGVRDIKSYNNKVIEKKLATNKLPYLVFVVDEFADLMATSGKELEGTLARLAAMSRAVGIHLVLATQRPSIDVITGLIKANFPSRIAFMVASKTDSRIIIDSVGAEKLLGKGDMLFLSSWNPFPSRLQGPFLSEDEVERVVTHVKTLGEPEYIDDEIFIAEDGEDIGHAEHLDPDADNLYPRATEIVLQAGKASASFLQRRLGIGYNRAARLIEIMEDQGLVGPQNGSKPREVIGLAG